MTSNFYVVKQFIFLANNNFFFISLKPDTDILLVCPLSKFILVRRRLHIMQIRYHINFMFVDRLDDV